MKFLLDTNVISEITRPRPDERVEQWFLQANDDELFLSVVSIAEIRRGISGLPSGARKRALLDWFHGVLLPQYSGRVFEIDVPVSLKWGELSFARNRSGGNAHILDAFIAATALVHDCTLVTRNTRDFMGWGVELLDPWCAPKI